MALSKTISEEQKQYLRESTRYFRGIEKPLKYGPAINTLQELKEALYKEFDSDFVNIEMVNHIMLSYKSNPKEWRKFAKFDRYKYTRNLVDAGNGRFNLLILCWGEGHGSMIHDHANSHCFMKMLKGELREIRYKAPIEENISDNIDMATTFKGIINTELGENNEKQLQEVGTSMMALNDVAYINDNIGLHRVENPSYTETAISLHLYCPPFNSCSVFPANSTKKMACPVTFWSQFGEKQQTKN